MLKKYVPALLIGATLLVSGAAAAGSDATTGRKSETRVVPETVGSFAIKLATALTDEKMRLDQAVAMLRKSGAAVGTDLNARLTEEEASRILSDLGMKVMPPENPASEVSTALGTQLAIMAGLTLSPGIEDITFPIHCLNEKNRGQCLNCCKDANPGLDVAKICGQICRGVVPPPPSPDDPPT